MIIISVTWMPSPQGLIEFLNNPFCEYSQSQVYRHQMIRCITVSQTPKTWDDDTFIIAEEAFGRLAQAMMQPIIDIPEVTTSLYDFLTFVQSHAWHPVYFDVPEAALPILNDFSRMCIEPDLELPVKPMKRTIVATPPKPRLLPVAVD